MFNLLNPSPSINYTVITYMYAACCLLSLIFYVLEVLLTRAEEGEGSGGNLEQVKGVYVIFLPFWPCLCWSAAMAKRAEGMEGRGGREEMPSKKKTN